MDLHFDPYQFAGRRAQPVSSETHIAFEDYRRMSVSVRKLAPGRRLETPEWAVNDAKLREVIVRFMETRALLLPGNGTPLARLQRAQEALQRQICSDDNVLTSLCNRYVVSKRSGACDPATLRGMEIQIENLDTKIRMGADCAGMILRLVHLYYRVGMDSVAVADELHLKPGHVRRTLWRLNYIAGCRSTGTSVRRHAKRRLVKSSVGSYVDLTQSEKEEIAALTIPAVQKHFRRLKLLALKNKLGFPAYKWLNENGYFGSYDAVRKAGMLPILRGEKQSGPSLAA